MVILLKSMPLKSCMVKSKQAPVGGKAPPALMCWAHACVLPDGGTIMRCVTERPAAPGGGGAAPGAGAVYTGATGPGHAGVAGTGVGVAGAGVGAGTAPAAILVAKGAVWLRLTASLHQHTDGTPRGAGTVWWISDSCSSQRVTARRDAIGLMVDSS